MINKMKIPYFPITQLHNDAHFQHHTDFGTVVERHGADKLGIGVLWVLYVALVKDEDTALKKILKSAITAEIHSLDKSRDQIWQGMAETNRAALKHYNEEVRKAAERNQIVFDTYGNVAKKPLDEETSAIYNFIQDMRGKYAADAATVGLTGWIDELEKINNEFKGLMMDRYDETALRTDIVMKDVRVKVDEAYRNIIDRINTSIVIEGEEKYREFVIAVNAVIKRYSDILAQQKGRAAAKKEPKE
jgi:hypothetical protein